MPQQRSAAQVQAYRFGTRRLAHAVEHGSADLVPFAGPRRGLALVIGAVVVGLVLAGFAVYGLVRPAPAVGDAKVLVDGDQGGAYVVRDGVIHPALNIASAMLAAVDDQGGGANGSVRQVSTQTLESMPRGATVGIAGAPNAVPPKTRLVADTWSVCDTAAPDPAAAPGTLVKPTTTVVVGQPLVDDGRSTAVVVTADGSTHYLVWAGHRARIGTTSGDAVAATLGVTLRSARTVSRSFLDSVPEQAPLVPVAVPGAGAPMTRGGLSAKVGDVLRTDDADAGGRLVLVLRDGLQPVSDVFADLVRAGTGQTSVPTISPGQVAAVGMSTHPLATDRYPATRPVVVDPADRPVLCSGWSSTGGTVRQTLATASALPLPAGARPVPVPARPDAEAPAITSTYVTPGSGIVVNQSVDGRGTGTGNLLLVTDQGTRYPVVSPGALAALGLGSDAAPAPSYLLGLLPLGPTLDPAAARAVAAQAPGAPVSATP